MSRYDGNGYVFLPCSRIQVGSVAVLGPRFARRVSATRPLPIRAFVSQCCRWSSAGRRWPSAVRCPCRCLRAGGVAERAQITPVCVMSKLAAALLAGDGSVLRTVAAARLGAARLALITGYKHISGGRMASQSEERNRCDQVDGHAALIGPGPGARRLPR